MKNQSNSTMHITIKGLIQGIGFRPFVYNLALSLDITGYIRNISDAVEIMAQGSSAAIDTFITTLQNSPPPLARIDSLEYASVDLKKFVVFTITESVNNNNAVTDISPDIAVCEHCLDDMKEQPHRISYPLTNCTLCGPRFSIIRTVPYDRQNTTMASFTMCKKCAREYTDPADRRFHAQPVACNDCGPSYTLHSNGNRIEGNEAVVAETVRLIEAGAVVAIKGTGGFHLAANPFDVESIKRLRSGKRRDGKPFALMFRDSATLRNYADVNKHEKQLLQSTVCPIVLLAAQGNLPSEVNNNLSTIGAMLPYMPFHHLLFEQTQLPAIVMTSGNISEEPIVINNDVAIATFEGIADAVVVYDRDIHNRVDDSVCAVFDGTVQIIRRSRGFAPSPIILPLTVDGIVAAGAELKNCFALGKGDKAIVSQHIGDLKNSETLAFYKEAFDRLCKLFRVEPLLFAHDLHPDYLSTNFALESGLPTLAVQHHHAHIVSCCAENGISGQVIGVALDGTGYGSDGAVWGGEFMLCNSNTFKRMTHLRYVGMPGGDRAAVEPWRMAASYLYDCYGIEFARLHPEFFTDSTHEHLTLIGTALEKGINTPRTSSAGRLFDAVAALCGLCDAITFEAEAAMRLESLCGDPLSVSPYQWESSTVIDLRDTIRQIVDERNCGTCITKIATRFHATIIDIIISTCRLIRSNTGINKVVLSGGCFQNRCIFNGTVRLLQDNHFPVFTHHQVPCNDGGIALGQLVVAAATNR